MTEPKVDRRKAARDQALAAGGIPFDPYPGYLTWFFRDFVETGGASGLNQLCRLYPEREIEILETWCRLATGHPWAWHEARSGAPILDDVSVGWPDEAKKRLEEPVAMMASPTNARWINALKKVSSVMNLVVLPFLCSLGCAIQRLRNVVFVHFFKILVMRKSIPLETLLVISAERVRISDDPCFHCLNHEMNNVVANAVEIPSVSFRQMVGWIHCAYRIFGIHQKHDNAGILVRARVLEAFVCLVAAAATNHPPMPVSCPASPPEFGQKHLHSLAQLSS